MHLTAHVVLIIVILHHSSLLESNRGCQGENDVCSTCTCSDNDSVVDCSNMNMTIVPPLLPRNMTFLKLSSNLIRHLSHDSFKNCIYLQYLDLSSNLISGLSNNLFKDQGQTLISLFLQNNKLHLQSNDPVLRTLNMSLKILHIQQNADIAHEVIDGLYYLEELHLSGNINGSFGTGFSSLKSLKRLKVYRTMEVITNTTFENLRQCTNLTRLDLSGVGIANLDDESFRPLQSLRSLNLGYNEKLNLENVTNPINSLPNGLEELILTGLVGNVLPTLTVSTKLIKNLGNKSLKRLLLNKNNFIYIDDGFTFALKHLEYLDISFNRYINVNNFIMSMFVMRNLTSINSDNQSRRPIFDDPDSNDPQKDRTEPIFNAHDSKVTKFQTKNQRVNHYSKETCVVGVLKPCIFPIQSQFPAESWCIPMSRNLKRIQMSGTLNVFTKEYPPVLIFGEMGIEEIYVRDNDLRLFRGPIVILRPINEKPLMLDISYNRIYCFAPGIFEMSITRGLVIGSLNLEGNDLSEQMRSDVEGRTFELYTSLTVLNLSNNKLKQLHKKSFRNLFHLETLNLSTNSLQILSFDILSLINLRNLDVSSNLFVTFDAKVTTLLSSISSKKGYSWFTFIIRDNPFQCSCDMLYFLNWISSNETKISDLPEVTCLYQSQTMSMTKFCSEYRTNLKLFCYYYLPFLIFGGLMTLLIICIMVGTIAYNYRWDIRYYIIIHSQKKVKYQLLLDQENDYLYDAFVSYDMNETHWVVHELIANIESHQYNDRCKHSQDRNTTKYGSMDPSQPVRSSSSSKDIGSNANEMAASYQDLCFRLCIHERDFEPGRDIESNILSAIQGSRMIILIITDHFIKSKWCRLELEMAKMESLERGRNVVMTVFVEPIHETLESLEWLMRRYTYLEWFKCDTTSKKEDFWKMLKVALGNKMNKKQNL